MLIELLIGIVILLLFICKRLSANHNFFEKLGIPYVKPKLLVGSFYGFLIRKESFREEFLRHYNNLKHLRVFGAFDGSTPVLVVNDLELIKQITVKNFESFRNHRQFSDPEDNPLFGNSLLSMKDEKWHSMRTMLSPAFTGSKMRLMFQLILDICERAVKHLEVNVKNKPNSEDGVEIEMKDFFTLYTNDAIASTAFGLEVNSLADKNNEFYKMGRHFISLSNWDMFKFVLYRPFKPLFKLFGISLGNKKFDKFFIPLVLDAMKYRKEHNIVRQDMINILIEARNDPDKSNNHEWTDIELVAQCLIFFFAGLESVSTTLCFATQQLIENLDVQEKLYLEIESVNKQLNGEPVTYEILKSMKYMDMFISEVLRMWPPFIHADRVCTKSFEHTDEEFSVKLNVDDVVLLPIIGIHLNEKYFPNPLKFDPERFSDENKSKIEQLAYAPFGYGPRMCIASRLALLECKAILFHILTNFKLEAGTKTTIPIQLAPTFFPISVKQGFWLKMLLRN